MLKRFLIAVLLCFLLILATKACLGANGKISDGVVITHYDIALTPNFSRNAMTSHVECLLRNDSRSPVDEIAFDLLNQERRSGVAVQLGQVQVRTGKSLLPATCTRADDPQHTYDWNEKHEIPKRTTVTLPTPLLPDRKLSLIFDYTWQSVNASQLDDCYVLFATFPNGEKEVSLTDDHTWLPTVVTDHPHIKPGWQLRMTVPEGYECAALGGQYQQTVTENGLRTHYWQSRVVDLPQVLIGHYDRITLKRLTVTVSYYLPKGKYAPATLAQIADQCEGIYRCYSTMLGPLQHREIQIGLDTSGGMGGKGGYASLLLYRDTLDPSRPFGNDEVNILAHELAHSWWGILVTGYGQGARFLHESFAEYLANVYLRQSTGKPGPQWQESLCMLFASGLYDDPVILADHDDEQLVYVKGPFVLQILCDEMGKKTFTSVLKTFFTHYRQRYATFADFNAVCHEVTGKRWDDFFAVWLLKGGCPDYRLVAFTSTPARQGWQTVVKIRNAGKGIITCPLELQMAAEKQRAVFRVAEGKEETLTYTTPGQVQRVVIDPDHTTYQGGGMERLEKMLVSQNFRGVSSGKILAVLGRYDQALQELTPIVETDTPYGRYWRGIVYYQQGKTTEAAADFRIAITTILEMLKTPDSATPEYCRRGATELQNITGHALPYDSKSPDTWAQALALWETWWTANEATFTPAATTGNALRDLREQYRREYQLTPE